MNRKFLILNLLFTLMLTTSCQTQDTNNEDINNLGSEEMSKLASFDLTSENDQATLRDWIAGDENGLKITRSINSFDFVAQLIPPQLSLIENNESGELDATMVAEVLKEYQQSTIVQLKISNKYFQDEMLKYNLPAEEQYSMRVQYFSFGLKQDIVLVCGEDTLQCQQSHWERAYDATPRMIFNLVFDRCEWKDSQTMTLIYNDMVFGNGPIKFRFGKK
jgi:hypothetical protein